MTAGRTAAFRGGRLVLLTIAFISVAHGWAGAYRFYSGRFFTGDREGRRIVGSEDARRWSPEVWGPGETLVWEIAPDPDFEVIYGAPQEVLPFVEQALAAWRDIPTADISWNVTGVGEGDPLDPRADVGARDGRNTLFLDAGTDSAFGGYARIWSDDGGRQIRECDVAFGPRYSKVPEDLVPADLDDFRNSVRIRSVSMLVHEFGHCLGLQHAGAISAADRLSRALPRSQWPWNELVHPRDPAMSYGFDQEDPDGLAADDVVGASLLRPARGWQRATGSLSGSIRRDGEPAPYAHVWALPMDGDPLRDRVGAFSDGQGAFVIEGLRPGDYALWAQPISRQRAHPSLIVGGPLTDFDDMLSVLPIRVQAGQATGDLELAMWRGRTVRPPPDENGTTPATETPLPITRDWGNPCSGIRIRGEPPYPADAPLWFARYDSRFRRERWFATRMTLERSPEAGNTVIDWAGPYRNWRWNRGKERADFYEAGTSPTLDISISDWRIENTGSVVRLVMDIAWPETTEARLRFRSEDGACEGEPMVVCSLAGCGITE